MAREIDLTKKLSAADRQYLVDRDRWHDIARADGLTDGDEAREAHKRKLAADPTQVSAPPTVFPQPGTDLPKPPGELEEEDLPYDEWVVADLKQELKVRRDLALAEKTATEEEAATRYSTAGSKADLVARLQQDDEQVAPQQ